MDYVRSAPHYPSGLVHAATLLAGRHDLVLLDERTDADFDARLGSEMEGCGLVGVTSMSGSQIGHACRLARVVRARSRIPVVWGGLHASLLPEQVLSSGLADYVVRGEGEEAFDALVTAVERGGGFDDVPALSFRKDGKVVHNPRARPIRLDTLPDPAWGVADPRRYAPVFAGRPTLNVETSRGCPNRCSFCYNLVFNRRRWRGRSAPRVVDMLGLLVGRFGIRSFYFTDDNFFADRRRAFAIVREILARGLDIRFQLQGVEVKTINSFSDGELDLLVRAGCNRFSVGAESGSQKVIDYLAKELSPGETIAANRRMRGWPIVVYYSFMSGFPGETIDDLNATMDLALRLTAENEYARSSPIYGYFPLPGTPLFEKLVRESGYVPPERLEDWAAIDYGAVNFCGADAELRRAIARAYVPSLFIDDKFGEYSGSAAFQAAARLYRPIARARLSHRFLGLPLEGAAYAAYVRTQGDARGGTQT
ncbi:MAG: B12-binding domain-containing radical SAM protein [Deltaproteobacteria bacterium]|nr:B12-binding domain-containing radical SAM protein [Deltaproteobacteria bacterium]